MWETIKAGLVALGQFLGVIQKGQDAARDTQLQQGGADQQKAASLDATVQTAQAQTAAIVNAPKTVDGTVDALNKGAF